MNKLKHRIRAIKRRNVKLTLKMAKVQYKLRKRTRIIYENGYVEEWYTYKFFKLAYKAGLKDNNIAHVQFMEDNLI